MTSIQLNDRRIINFITDIFHINTSHDCVLACMCIALIAQKGTVSGFATHTEN